MCVWYGLGQVKSEPHKNPFTGDWVDECITHTWNSKHGESSYPDTCDVTYQGCVARKVEEMKVGQEQG